MATAAQVRKEKAAILAESLMVYADDPVGFTEDFLNRKPWERQRELMTALIRTGRVSMRSGHGAGKTDSIAYLLLWAVCCRPGVEGCVTAPTFRQLTNVVFRRVEEILRDAPLLKDLVVVKKTSVEFGGNLIQAATARKGEGLQGIHARPGIGTVLIIVEEASGVPDSFFNSLEGALSTGKALILLVGNPTQRQGKFFDSHNAERADWYTMRVSAEESPLVERDWLESRKRLWGEDSDQYRVRVLGEFPSVDGFALIPLEWMNDAKLVTDTDHRKLCGPTDGYVIGVDPARQGRDSTFVAVRRGRFILGEYFAEFKGLRTTEVAGYIEHLYNDLKRISPLSPNGGQMIRPIVCVDAVGIGAGVYDTLRDHGVNVRAVQASALAPETSPPCHRLRDWLYWQLRELFNPENELDPVILIPGRKDKRNEVFVPVADKLKLVERMISEGSGLLFKYLPGDKIQIESKDDYRERNSGRSPDAADAVCLSFMRDNRVPRRKVVDIFERRRRPQSTGWVI